MHSRILIRATWSHRPVSRAEGAERLSQLLRGLAVTDKALGEWELDNPGMASGPASADPERLLPLIRFDQEMPQFGYSFLARTPDRRATLSLLYGASLSRYPHAGGEVLLQLPPEARFERKQDAIALMSLVVTAWRADAATVTATTAELTSRFAPAEEWRPGWLTYVRAGASDLRLRVPSGVAVESRDAGWLFQLKGGVDSVRGADRDRLAEAMAKTFGEERGRTVRARPLRLVG